MPLTDAQIERYSRQIIVPRFGGRGQERLLAAKVFLAGDAHDLEQPLAYLVGAGIGSIHLSLTQEERSLVDLLKQMRALNPDVSITPHSTDPAPPDGVAAPPPRFDLALLLLASDASRAIGATLAAPAATVAFIFARLGDSPRLAILPPASPAAPPDAAPCPRCALTSLLSPLPAPTPDAPASASALHASFVAMLATTEALKLLSGFVEHPSSVIIDFDGYSTRTSALSLTCTRNHSAR